MKKLALAFAALAFGCSPKATEEECQTMLKHIIDVQAKSQGIDSELVKEAAAKELKSQIAECTSKISQKAMRCALAAQTSEELEKCD